MQQSPNLLLVDDKPENLLALESILDDLECNLFKALSGHEALRQVIKHDFALAVVDVQMPGMNGFELAELLRGRQETRHLPIIFVTAISKEKRYVFKGYEVGAVDYLFKPIEPDILRSKVNVFLELYGQRQLLAKQALELESKMTELQSEILERRRVETELQKALGTINRLASGMAHELNNVLAIMLSSLELVIDDLTDSSPIKSRLEQTYRSGMRGRDLVEDILAYSRSSQHKLHPLKLDHVFQNIIQMIQPTLPPNVTIHHHFDSHCHAVLASPLHIEQIIINLCKNAADALDGREGNIKIDLEEIEYTTPPSQFANISKGRYVRFTVQDDGEGMTPELKESIFTPFFTTKEVGKGTGLGLSVVYGIVQQYGGEIAVASEPGKGTTFEILLPVVQEISELAVPNEVSPQRTNKVAQKSLKNQHFLLVNDDPAELRLPMMALKKLGYATTVAISSVQALDLFRSDPQQFDLVITDFTMLDMTGIEMCRKIRSLRPEISLILCIERGETVDSKITDELGIKKLLRKPLAVRLLIEAIRELL